MHDPVKVLVVDDNRVSADAMAKVLGREGCQVRAVYDGESAIAALKEQSFSLVLTDLCMEPVDGLAVVRAARSLCPAPEVLVFTGFGTVEAAVEAMRLGARDFLTKPVSAELLRHRVSELKTAPDEDEPISTVGESSFIVALRRDLAALAQVRSTVLLRGEPGTGRTHLARWLHANGPDRRLPFHVPDLSGKAGFSQLSRQGTILLRRVDTLDEERAIALLKLLEQLPLGEAPRVMATVYEGARERMISSRGVAELYYRLAVVVLDIPPLRQRSDDIPPLLRHFTRKYAGIYGRSPTEPSPRQLRMLASYQWPGNVRELANLAERAVVMGPRVFDISGSPGPAIADGSLPELKDGFQLSPYMDSVERAILERAIRQTGGDRVQMCRILGLGRNTLRYKLRKYKLISQTNSS